MSDKLRIVKWSDSDSRSIGKYFAGKHTEWTKKSLKEVRANLRVALLKAQKCKCVYCKRPISIELGRNEIDHIVPKSMRGCGRFTYERINLAAACKRCNKNKSNFNTLAVRLGRGCSYPRGQDDYAWVHPYIHRYSDHIILREGFFFAATGSAEQKRRAENVIRQCKLDQISTVESIALSEFAQAADGLIEAVLGVLARPLGKSDGELAKIIKKSRRELRDYALGDIERLIKETRESAFSGLSRALKRTPRQSRKN